MAKPKNFGYLPETLSYVVPGTWDYSTKFDDYSDSPDILSYSAQPAFVLESGNPKTLETATNWAKGYKKWDALNEGVNSGKLKEPRVDVFPNDPIEGVRIVGLEVRSEGGRAWKALIRGKYLVDLREDVYLEASLSCGVTEGGHLGGSYVFAKIGSQTKLVRWGSALHSALLDSVTRREVKKISAREAVPGTVYEKRSGEFLLYLGKFATTTILQYGSPARISSQYDYTMSRGRRYYIGSGKSAVYNVEEEGFLFYDLDIWGYRTPDPTPSDFLKEFRTFLSNGVFERTETRGKEGLDIRYKSGLDFEKSFPQFITAHGTFGDFPSPEKLVEIFRLFGSMALAEGDRLALWKDGKLDTANYRDPEEILLRSELNVINEEYYRVHSKAATSFFANFRLPKSPVNVHPDLAGIYFSSLPAKSKKDAMEREIP